MAEVDLATVAIAPAAITALPALPVRPTAAPNEAGAFDAALRAASVRAGGAALSPAQPATMTGESFGLERALGVIAALRPASPAPPPAAALADVVGAAPLPLGVAPPSGAGSARVSLAAAELGVAESTPGSNDGARIAEYRTAVPGGPVGPWCAYFVSYISGRAGTPLGDNGQGFAAVEGIRAWLAKSGRLAEGPTAGGRPGDLVFFDRDRDGIWDHVGFVEAVLPDGRIQTLEGNTSDAVGRRVYDRGEIAAIGSLA